MLAQYIENYKMDMENRTLFFTAPETLGIFRAFKGWFLVWQKINAYFLPLWGAVFVFLWYSFIWMGFTKKGQVAFSEQGKGSILRRKAKTVRERDLTHEWDALLSGVDAEPAASLQRYFEHAPSWLVQSFQAVDMDKNQVFVEENKTVDSVYFLVSGIVKAVDYRIFGIAYDYMWFYPVKSFGAMEILLDMEMYRTTLMTVTPCRMLTVSKGIYEKWLRGDIQALSMEIKSIGCYLLDQSRKERTFLFVQGVDRVYFLFTQLYEQMEENGLCIIRLTRQELADRCGLSVKTVNRAVERMQREGCIGRRGNRIVIHSEQYLQMKGYLSSIIDQA